MKFVPIFITAAALIFGLSGCGSSPTNTASQSNVQRNAVPAESPADNSQALKTQNNGPNDRAANNVVNGRRRMAEVPGGSETLQPSAVPAPENSAISTTMAADGSFTEIRVFTSDKDIDRVKKISKNGTQTVTIILRNGRSVQAPAGKVPSVKTISLADLKAIAGIGPKLSTKPAERSEKGSVKPQP